jgi:hypothetical protein
MDRSRRPIVAGGVVSGLAAATLVFSAAMKLAGGEQVVAGMAHLGLPDHLIVPIAVLELACVALYLVPATSVLGAVLLTGYLGGAILAHLRVGDPVVVPALLGGVVWLGLYLRERKLHELLPLRRAR